MQNQLKQSKQEVKTKLGPVETEIWRNFESKQCMMHHANNAKINIKIKLVANIIVIYLMPSFIY